MKSLTIAAAALLLGGFVLADDLHAHFDFFDNGQPFDAVDHPYNREGADDQCISHLTTSDKSANHFNWKVPGVLGAFTPLPPKSYCVYAFYTDGMCGGSVDEMIQIPRDDRSDLSSDSVDYSQPVAATVIRSGACPAEMPDIIEAPSPEDLGQ